MNRRRKQTLADTLAGLVSLACAVGLAVSALAQNYSVDWFKIAGGGGTATGGVYTAAGTLGQPDAGTASGGNFTPQGGFWSLLAAVPTPGALKAKVPRLRKIVLVAVNKETGRMAGLRGLSSTAAAQQSKSVLL